MAVLKAGDIESARQDFLACRDELRAAAHVQSWNVGADQSESTSHRGQRSAPHSAPRACLTELALPAETIPRHVLGMAVRYTLYVLERVAPGPGVEVRIAPFAAVKVLDGPKSDPHNLTPPDVIELEPWVWMRMACGITTWAQEKAAGHISAMGERDNLARFLPIEA